MSDDVTTIDGDRLIAFINAVKSMGNILEQIQVRDMADAFRLKMQMGCTEKIIQQQKDWAEAFRVVANAMEDEVKHLKLCQDNSKDMLKYLQSCADKAGAVDCLNASLQDLCELCDRLEKHRQSGLLDALASMGAKP